MSDLYKDDVKIMLDTMSDSSKDAGKALLNAVNPYGFDASAFAKEVCNGHRTLQQSVMRAFAACLQEWAKADASGMKDLRNEQTCKVAAKIVRELGDDLFFPMV